jgi:hypothetical protein
MVSHVGGRISPERAVVRACDCTEAALRLKTCNTRAAVPVGSDLQPGFCCFAGDEKPTQGRILNPSIPAAQGRNWTEDLIPLPQGKSLFRAVLQPTDQARQAAQMADKDDE